LRQTERKVTAPRPEVGNAVPGLQGEDANHFLRFLPGVAVDPLVGATLEGRAARAQEEREP
jgi:hypothetical protein